VRGAGLRSALVFLAAGLLVGLLLTLKEGPRAPSGPAPARRVARELTISRPGSPARILFGASAEGTPAMWMSNGPGRGTLQAGVHGNGFPFVLVSDAAVRSFGLGRVDGINASPILVYRSDDVVRLVFGLSMTEAGQPAFLVHYTGDGTRHEFLGRYCDDPGRVCTR